MKKAIVTGANGFVGSAVVKELAANGVQVYAVVMQNAVNLENLQQLPGVILIGCDLAEYDSLAEKIANKDIDVFYHFAWAGTAGEARGDEELQLNNVKYSCKAVQACAELQCSKFIFAASIMQYEVAALKQTNKQMPKTSIYCTAKIAADYMCRALADSLGVQYVSAIISNIYGPGEVSPRLINTSIRKLQAGEHTSFSAGEQLYDFIYIDDAARMFKAIGEQGANAKNYYIGNKEPRRLKEFLLEMRDVVALEAEIGLGELSFDGVSLTYKEFDMQSAYRDTGINPQVSFTDGIRRTANWLKKIEETK